MAAAEIPHVRLANCCRNGGVLADDTGDNPFYIARRNRFRLEREDIVGHVGKVHHLSRQNRLEGRLPGERHDGMHRFRPQARQPYKPLYVQIVLPKRILEPVLPPMEHLRPLGVSGIAEYPSLVGLRLDDKHAERRDDDMVDLRIC